jgi:hypothetical protein
MITARQSLTAIKSREQRQQNNRLMDSFSLSVMLLLGHLSIWTGWTASQRAPQRLPPRVVRTCTSHLTRSHRTRLAPSAPCASCLTPLHLPPRVVCPCTSRLARSHRTRLTPRAPHAPRLVPSTPTHALCRPHLATLPRARVNLHWAVAS